VNYFLHSNSFFNSFHFYRFFNRKKNSASFFLEENGVHPSYYFVQQNFFLDEMDSNYGVLMESRIWGQIRQKF